MLSSWLLAASLVLYWSLRAWDDGSEGPSRPPSTPNKLILSWVPFFGDPHWGIGSEPDAFARLGCSVSTCELTGDRSRVPLERFDALLFHGFEYYNVLFGTPNRRSPRQQYVFATLESARRGPIPEWQEHFYNLTMTYRLDSDAPWPYFAVVDDERDDGADVGPALDPHWDTPRCPKATAAWNATLALIAGKTRPVAWFASNCRSESGREAYVAELSRHLPVDVYGACGSFKCPLEQAGACDRMLGERYMFYLAFENSLCREYVTEKTVRALLVGSVPVVRAGYEADELRRFLPPGSYVVADEEPRALAARLLRLMSAESRDRYERLLWWRGRYRVERRMPADRFPAGKHPLCRLCALLHEQKPPLAETRPRGQSVREWWGGNADRPTCR